MLYWGNLRPLTQQFYVSPTDNYYDQNQTQFQAQAQAQATGNHPQQPPPPYIKNPSYQQYPGQYSGNPQNQMGNSNALKSPMMERGQQFIQVTRKPQNMNQNMMAGMFVPGFNNNKPPYPNQVSRETYNGEMVMIVIVTIVMMVMMVMMMIICMIVMMVVILMVVMVIIVMIVIIVVMVIIVIMIKYVDNNVLFVIVAMV